MPEMLIRGGMRMQEGLMFCAGPVHKHRENSLQIAKFPLTLFILKSTLKVGAVDVLTESWKDPQCMSSPKGTWTEQ
jgi:hypothetical protein